MSFGRRRGSGCADCPGGICYCDTKKQHLKGLLERVQSLDPCLFYHDIYWHEYYL